jgi:ribosomal protein S18 acetylase RimI-like enzyme
MPGEREAAERLIIRRIRRPAADLLARLEGYDREAFGETSLRTYDLAVMAQAGAVLSAYVDEEIVGGCQLLRILDEPDFFYVVGFYMRPGWQGRRLGRTFLVRVAEEVKRLGGEGMVLTVAPGNRRALHLYESVGFVVEGLVSHFYGNGHDRHVLRWRFGRGDLHGSV